ncbi:protein-L-isoaspartate(D-aspartate) O-methyltransferase [Aeromonas sobria]|uniref:Protein-L-isoaspartate O-methyltransferase n=1 Tax=Aeromonas sobria TaxID=646 RepID=A0A2N3ITJ9_AERSO|nr:protein-L-isoaspartate(D-aspartate) O-methyltransferase [Aeromonas sobria]ELM3618149.1 protein-L-isoaspartate(D-aspartate) O-methyltransferase [Aeromonas sobria]PKQ72508.1 protein-L-isoaspartate O-methyltransferase [Aeromonas sobria]PKQ73693.1 protein-L-isoaspartate O-methyltransferase [Aeromonas sobria]PKQ75238.1 protein-L-isoaspartate O-methyltransferase [Aeromonas sobria]TNH91651.1 protein-L-isoaspartate O-methyltransferase [Aeromonas sobria]
MIVQRLLNQLIAQDIRDFRVLATIAKVPRQLFVDEAMAHKAWDNTALPIGHGQTISQPYMVARMTELLMQNNPAHVLEIGTGSGYQTAILAHLVEHVYTVERIKSLQFLARRRLRQLDLHNVSAKHGNGWLGWANKGPYDAILVTAAASEIPTALTDQLAEGGRLVLPVGDSQQTLQLIERSGSQLTSRILEPVRFVPLIDGDVE